MKNRIISLPSNSYIALGVFVLLLMNWAAVELGQFLARYSPEFSLWYLGLTSLTLIYSIAMLASGAKVILAIYYDYPPTGDEYKSLKICASVVGFFVFFIFFRDHKDGWRHEIWIGSMVVVFNLLFLAVVKIAKEYRNSAIDLPRTPLKMIFGHWPDNGLEADKPPTWEHERVIDEWRVRQQKEFQENLERRKSTQ